MISIAPIERLNPLTGTQETQQTPSVSEEFGLFGDVFRSAIENVKTTDAEKTEAEYLLATGQLDNPAALSIASTRSELAVQMLVQLRNRALEAYQELSRISM